MRIVILTHHSERHYYFCNQLIEKTGHVVGIITGAKEVHRSRKAEWQRRRRRKEVLSYVRQRVLNLCFRSYGKRFWQEKEATEARFFSGAADHFAAHYRHLVLAQVDAAHRSINHRYYVELVRDLEPDVIAVMGTCMLGKRMLALAPYVLNMHTGLSPYYRGGQSNMWPILEGDFGYFGVTVHHMSPGIDSGDIVYSQRPEVAAEDTYVDINCKCIVLGSDLMVQAIQQVEAGTMEAVAQWTSGKLFLDCDMSHYTAYRYFKKRRAFMEQYCRLACEQQLPHVRLIS